MAKSKNRSKNSAHIDRFASRERQPATDKFSSTLTLAFRDHSWPAGRKTVLDYAKQHGTLGASDLARLKRIPDREYASVGDLVDAARAVTPAKNAPIRDDAGPVATAESNRRAGAVASRFEDSQEEFQGLRSE